MLIKKEFLTIFQTFSNLNIVKQTLPTVIAETNRNNAALIVWDCTTTNNRFQKQKYLLDLRLNDNFFLVLSDNLSVADSRNTCLYMGQQLFCPEYICIIDDDHGYRPGVIKALVLTMKKYYGQKSPNGLKYGMFTACGTHRRGQLAMLPDGNFYPVRGTNPNLIGGQNGCFRCAPTSHWNNIIKGYDSDEYLLSCYQSSGANRRNYHNGFTIMRVGNGNYSFQIPNVGRGTSARQLIFDPIFTASDNRAKFKKD